MSTSLKMCTIMMFLFFCYPAELPDNVTNFDGNDFKETYRKVVKWLEDRKFM